MLPDFNRLRVFYYIYQSKSVTLAANQLNITSSAVSQALNKLEGELNVPLFTRLHKQLVPTSSAEHLYEVIDPFIHQLTREIEQMHKAKEVPSGMLRIGSPIEFGKSYFPRIFAAFRRQYPEVVFTMKLGDPSEIFPMIRSGELDFGLVDVFLTRDQIYEDFGIYSIEPLINEVVVMACSKGYYENRIKADHSFENLVGQSYISYQKSSLTLRNWFKHHFNKFSLDLNRVLTVDSHQAVITGIKHDLGMGVIASHIVRKDIQNGEIIPIKTKKKDVINRISLVQLLDKIPGLTEKTFIAFLKDDILSSGRPREFSHIS